jgi:hypothetical protein
MAAMALLAVNDRLFKQHWPGLVTGKLSDLAICFLLPLYLSALLGLLLPARPHLRLIAGASLAAAVFTLLELSSDAVAAFCRISDGLAPALGLAPRCRMTSDLTDLGALLVVPLAYAYGRRRLGVASASLGEGV